MISLILICYENDKPFEAEEVNNGDVSEEDVASDSKSQVEVEIDFGEREDEEDLEEIYELVTAVIAAFTRMEKKGPRPLVICGPSGSGKSTLLKKLFKDHPHTFGFSVSHTTRKPRPGEENGKHYHFVEDESMQQAIERGDFLETAIFSGHLYGTSKQSVRDVQQQGRVCVLDIEIEGVKQLKNSDLNPILVFVLPPSIEELERRLRERKTENEESLQKRLKTAHTEISYGKEPGNFHKVVHNKHLKTAYEEFRDFIISELESQRNDGICVTLTYVDKPSP